MTISDRSAQLYAQEFANSISNDSLEIIAMPTEQCNFRCTYCYETFEVGRMKPRTVQGLKAFLRHRLAKLRRLNVEWFGGEPLVAKDIVLDVSKFIYSQAEQIEDLDYSGSMTTNGYGLTSTTLLQLVSVGVRHYQISLDGPPKLHDRTRVTASGGKTFDRIWRNLLSFRKLDSNFQIKLRLHLTPANLDAFYDFAPIIKNSLLADRRFSILIKPISKLGGKNDGKMTVLDHDAATEAVRSLEEALYGDSAAREKPKEELCYAAKPNSFVIRADGTIGKCTVLLNDSRNNIGRLTSNGQIEIDNSMFQLWMRGWQDLDPVVLRCPALHLPQHPHESAQTLPILQ